MRWQVAEHMNLTSAFPTGVIVLWTFNITISTMYSCQLWQLKTVQDVLYVVKRSVNGDRQDYWCANGMIKVITQESDNRFQIILFWQ